MQRDAATERQVRAAAPDRSTWLSANAGSGKTRVLTDRVARLLLGGTEPQKVLCLTYTKAAAAEMQNRLLRRLGQWAMLPDDALGQQLRELGEVEDVSAERLAEARRLFAKAIETPGGLKIQTIHSFCAALLRRFPLEGGVPHDFTEMDDRAAILLRGEVVEELAAGGDRGAVDALARHYASDMLDGLLSEICRNSDGFSAVPTQSSIWALFGLPEGLDAQTLVNDTLDDRDVKLIRDLVPVLEANGGNDAKAGAKLARVTGPSLNALAILEGVFLFGEKTKAPFAAKIGAFPTKDLRNGAAAAFMPDLEELMERVEAARPRRLALAVAERTFALHLFAAAFLPRYNARKAERGWLDFDDLIAHAGRLLSDPSVAQWVLFRLDGGIDHILVDEAQDTSPGQWAVIERLADEFTAGEGARDVTRTIFVVGDRKQSIYSFQGADLRRFEAMRSHFGAKFEAAGHPLHGLDLEHSFRSSQAVLRMVDITFDREGMEGLGGGTHHIAFHATLPGRVDLWPPIERPAKAEDTPWDQAIDQIGSDDERVTLARRIAQQIRHMIDTGTQIPDVAGAARAVHEGEFLILVQRRNVLFTEIIRQCKAQGLAIAGADRMALGAELAVRDIGSVLAFLSLPEDDLSLAAALRSPLFGWSEKDLFELAHGRSGYLWEALRSSDRHAQTLAILRDLRARSDFLRPYDLIERLLTRHGGRDRLIARLGAEAEDGIDELLAQALAFERNEVPSLTGFLVWLSAGDVVIKRQLEGGGRAIRVMTVHGAKGLEAPIVILPDTTKRNSRSSDKISRLNGKDAVWSAAAADSPPELAEEQALQKQLSDEERMRLLYVAMTRAEKWLIVAAAGDVGSGDQSWYSLIADGIDRAGAAPELEVQNFDAPFGPVRRVAFGVWPANTAKPALKDRHAATLPDWCTRLPPEAPRPLGSLSPSDLGGAKALAGEGALLDEQSAMRRGSQLHLLLEHLPLWPQERWPEIAQTLLLAGPDPADPAEIEPVLAEAERVLAAPEMAEFLAPEALAEVELTAALTELDGRVIHGTIDRLLVTQGGVRALDYKSNAIVPASASDVPLGILRQMAAYRAALAQIYPGHEIEMSILWTASCRLMTLPDAQLDAALRTATAS